MMKKEIEVFLTAFNEEKSIAETIYGCLAELEKLGLTHSVTVVDNGSTDNSKKIVEQEFHSYPNVSFFPLGINYGYSISVAKSMSFSSARYCIIMDADGQFSPNCFIDLISRIDAGADLVFGSRKHRVGDLRRKFGSVLFLKFARIILKFDGPDINAGIRAVSVNYRNGFKGAQRGRLANPNLWFQAKKNAFTVDYVSIVPRNRKAGSTSLPWSSPMRLTKESIDELYRIKKGEFDFVLGGPRL